MLYSKLVKAVMLSEMAISSVHNLALNLDLSFLSYWGNANDTAWLVYWQVIIFI